MVGWKGGSVECACADHQLQSPPRLACTHPPPRLVAPLIPPHPPPATPSQLDVRLTRRDPRWHCERSYRLSLAGGDLEIFFLDTSPFIEEYWAADWAGIVGE